MIKTKSNKKESKFKFLEHTADVKFQASGKSLEEAFSNCVLALRETITRGLKIQEKETQKIRVEGKDLENLLYAFLEEFLYLLDAKSFLVSKIKEIEIKDNKLTAIVVGDEAKNYKFSNPVKAITYNEMFVKQINNKWVCQVVLDV
mgnify:FL=1